MYVAPETVSIFALCAWSASWRRTGAGVGRDLAGVAPGRQLQRDDVGDPTGGHGDPDLDRAELGVDHRPVDGRCRSRPAAAGRGSRGR